MVILTFLSVIFVFSVIKPRITGLTVEITEETHTDNLNLVFNKTTDYKWEIKNPGKLNWAKVSGEIKGEGNVRIYLDNILILDSDNLKINKKTRVTGSTITGLTTESTEEGEDSGGEESSGSDSGEGKDSGGDDGDSSGESSDSGSREADKNEEASGSDSKGDSSESSGSDSTETEDTEDSAEGDKGESAEEPEEETEEEIEKPEKPSEEEPPKPEEEPEAPKEEESEEPKAEQNKTEKQEEPKEKLEEPKKDKEEKPKTKIIKFKDFCANTCNLSSLNLAKSSYTLKIKISNAKLNLDKIKYEVIVEKLIEKKEPKLNETEEQLKENITIPTNITGPPIQIKNIPNIKIEKNNFTTINIEKYFENAESYYLLQTKNISTTAYDHTLALYPDKNFTGIKTSRLIVKNEFGSAESNFFNISVLEFINLTNPPILIKNLPNIEIEKNGSFYISIQDYFENAEQYYLLQTLNISTTTYDHTISLKPDNNFVGNRTGKIIITNKFGSAESNFFNITVSEFVNITIPITLEENITNVTISTFQYKAIIHRPQKWLKVVKANRTEDIKNLTLEIPKQAGNISVKTGAEVQKALNELKTYEETIENTAKKDLLTGTITGNVALDIKNSQGIFTRLLSWLKSFTITGQAINEDELEDDITETENRKIIDLGTVINQTQATKIGVEYYTPGPIAVEQNISNGKRVMVSGPADLNFTDVLAFTKIPEKFTLEQSSRIKVYWREAAQYVNFSAHDLNNNGKLDYVEWLVPKLSNQTFDIILITKAEHLDENRTFVSDIYNDVKALDNNWSETIPNTHYIRVTFEINLTSNKDITLYPRTISGSPRIEVYEYNKTELIAEFTSLTDNTYNKVYLTNLQGSQDTFDLRVTNGDVQINHIIDPAVLPYTILNSPANASNFKIGTFNIILNSTIIDNNNSISVLIYGVNSTDTANFYDYLLYKKENVTNGTEVTYNFTALPIQPDSDFYYLWRFNNDSDLGENDTFFYNFGDRSNENVTCTTCPSINTTETKFGYSLDFDGSTDYLDIDGGDSANPVFDNAFSNRTISFWFYPRNLTNLQFIHEEGGGIHCLAVYINESLIFGGVTKTNVGYFTNLSLTTTKQWHFFAMSFQDDATITLFLDGTTTTTTATTGGLASHGGNDAIGRMEDNCQVHYGDLSGDTYYYNGLLDDYAVINRTITINELNNTFRLGIDKYFWKVNVTDVAGNNNESETREFNVKEDIAPPGVTINLPTSGTIYSASSLNFNVTLSENGNVMYSLDSGVNNVTMFDGANVNGQNFNHTNTSIGDGTYTFSVYANDTAGKNNYTESATFTIDTAPPDITFTGQTPANSSSQNNTDIYVNLSTSDSSDHYAFVDFDNDLVLWMRMDNTDSNGNPIDLSSYSNNGTLNGTALINSTGYFGNASHFDGNSDYINIPDDDSLKFGTSINFTISAWVNIINDSTDNHRIFEKRGASAAAGYAFLYSPEPNALRASLNSGAACIIDATTDIEGTGWHHVVAVFIRNASCSTDNILIYIDGSQESTVVNQSNNANDNIDDVKDAKIGSHGPLNKFFNGSIDEVLVFKRALNETEILALYNASANQYYHNFTALTNGTHTFTGYAIDIAGNKNQTEERQVTIINQAPQITFVQNISPIDLTEDNIKYFDFNFTATNREGASNLNSSTAQIIVQGPGGTNRTNSTCATAGSSFGNSQNYTCRIGLWYFDEPGANTWVINATIQDVSGGVTENSTLNFTINTLTAMKMWPTSLTWGSVTITSTNVGSNNDPITINNTGNDDITVINITAIDLSGETTSTQYIYAGNFTTDISSEGCSGTAMANNTGIQVSGASLSRGNHSVNDGSTGQEQLYFCLKALNPDLTQQPYSTSAGGEWTITILAATLIINRTLRKRKKKYLKKAIKLLKGQSLPNKEQVIELLLSELIVPITIFSSKLGALESVTRYMKDNLRMDYNEIATLLNRNYKTIWTAYHKAKEKQPKLETKETDMFIPVSIFKDSKLTILKAVIIFLKSKKMTYAQIGRLLNRDQRNIWHLYSQVKKVKQNNV